MFNHNLVSFRALCGLGRKKTGSADISGLGLVLCGHDAAILDRIEFQRSGVVDLFADGVLVARFQLSESSIISLDEFRAIPFFAGADDFAWLCGSGMLDSGCDYLSPSFMWRSDSGSESWRGDYQSIASRCGCLPVVSLSDDLIAAATPFFLNRADRRSRGAVSRRSSARSALPVSRLCGALLKRVSV